MPWAGALWVVPPHPIPLRDDPGGPNARPLAIAPVRSPVPYLQTACSGRARQQRMALPPLLLSLSLPQSLRPNVDQTSLSHSLGLPLVLSLIHI